MTEQSKELPLATSKEDLLMPTNPADRSFSVKEFEDGGKRHVYEIYDDISTREFNDCLKAWYSVNPATQKVENDIHKYHRRLIRAFVKDGIINGESETELIDLQENRASYVYKLIKLFPYDPIDLTMSDEAKKKLLESLEGK